MSEYIAVTSAVRGLDTASLKQTCLLFDRVLIDGLFRIFRDKKVRRKLPTELAQSLLYLHREGRVIDVGEILDDPNRTSIYLSKMLEEARELTKRPQPMKWEELVDFVPGSVCRAIATALRADGHADATVLYTPDQSVRLLEGSGRDLVARVVLSALPVPDETTPWEAIFDYRADPDARRTFLRLKQWMNEAAAAMLPASELEDKLLNLLAEYEHHMKLHRMKWETGYVEALITTSGDIAEQIIKMRWGALARSMFRVQHQRIALLEAEQKALGREIAYIINARSRFK